MSSRDGLMMRQQSWIALGTRQDWEDRNFVKAKRFDFDWVKNSVYNLLLEFEFDTLQKKHLELKR
jgi:hypothetical protein